MKIKKLTKSIAAVILGATMGFSAFAFVGCGHEDGGDDDGIDLGKAKIELTADKDEIHAGTNETVNFSTKLTELAEDSNIVWTVEGDGASYVEIKNGVLSFKQGLTPFTEKIVTVVATSEALSTVNCSYSIKLIPQVIKGQVGNLTTAMIQAVGNSQITVSGEVTDVYKDLKNDVNSEEQKFDFTVMMSDGAWYGEWNRKNSTAKEINNYRRAADPIEGSNQHTFNQVYINKDNEVAEKVITDTDSIPAIWEKQHYWNHLGDLATDINNKWEVFDEEADIYSYKFDNNSEDDLYLRAWLAWSLTPMLTGNDTLEQILLTVEDGKITNLTASTAVTYIGETEEGKHDTATGMKYTTLNADFTGVGDTAVPEPTPYKITNEAELKAAGILEKALENMGSATNYTYRAVETTLSAPSYDEGDYSMDAVTTYSTSAKNYTSSTGTEGVYGQVTENAILLAKTGKYTATLDGQNYWTKYSGYRQKDENTYDYFEYDTSLGALAGKTKYTGNLFDNMPKFEFSPYVFKLMTTGMVDVNGEWKTTYIFTIREPAITRDIAMQVSSHSYAKDAAGATHGELKITVREDGVLVSTEFPYDLVHGTYTGILKTTYSKIGETSLPEDTFDGYEWRVIKTDWSQYNVKYYHSTHSTLTPDEEIDGESLLKLIFASKYSSIPTPEDFINLFGDAMSGPFFEWKEYDYTAEGGEKEYKDYMSINLSVEKCDENGNIDEEEYAAKMAALNEMLVAKGYKLEGSKFTYTMSNGSRYTTYTNGNIMIRIFNMRSRYFFIDIMPVGIWLGA